MVDRRLVGITVMAFAVSSALFSLMIGERVSDPIEILKHEWNLPRGAEGGYRVPTEEGRYAYGLGIVARLPMSQLELFFITLENATKMLADIDLPEEESLMDIVRAIPEVREALDLVYRYSESDGFRVLTEYFKASDTGHFEEGLLIDITDPLVGTAPREVTRNLRSVHAVVKARGGVQYFRGHRDFFLDRDSTIIDISVQHNQNLTKYAQRTTEQGNSVPIDLAPAEGHISFHDLEKEDQLFVSFAINPSMVRTRENVLHVLIIYVDGAMHSSLVTGLERPPITD